METAALFTLATLFGGMVFFSFVFSPLVFVKLPAETAGPFIREVFPWYFLTVAILALAAGAALLAQSILWGAIMLAMGVLGVLNRQTIMPAINTARDAELKGDTAAGKRFHFLHRASVAINMVQMAAAAGALWSLA